MRNPRIAALGSSVAVVASAAVLVTNAFGAATSDSPGHDQACGTQANNAATQCFPSIQVAVDYAGPGGTVNVGPGQYAEHVSIQHGLTLRGAGQDTVITGALGTPLITVGGATPAPESPVTIRDLSLDAASGSGPGFAMVVKDRNPANLDSISNVLFSESGATQRDDGLLNENSTAIVSATGDTFRGMSVGMLIDVNSASASGTLGADLVSDDRFDHLVGVGKAPKGIDVSINTSAGNPGSESQVFQGDDFDFDTGSAIELDGAGPIGSVSAHENNFDGPAFGVNNASSNTSNNVNGTDEWWGCPDGPNGTQGHCSAVNGSVSYTPWLTAAAPNRAGADQ